MSPRITSLQNPRVKRAIRLRERRGRQQQGRIIIDGLREIARAWDAGLVPEELFVCREVCDRRAAGLLQRARQAQVALVDVAPGVFARLAFGERAEGIVAVAAAPPARNLRDFAPGPVALVAVLEALEKPGNVGAILRTADGAGVDAVLLADCPGELYNPNSIRASLGAVFHVPVFSVTAAEALDWLRREGFAIRAARVDGAVAYDQADYRGRCAVVLGNEAAGLTARWQAPGIGAIGLPMRGIVDSLNVAAAAAVLLYEAARQRQASLPKGP